MYKEGKINWIITIVITVVIDRDKNADEVNPDDSIMNQIGNSDSLTDKELTTETAIRTKLIERLSSEDVGFSFSIGDPVKGFDNDIGIKGKEFIQIYSIDEEIYELSHTFDASAINIVNETVLYGNPGDFLSEITATWVAVPIMDISVNGCRDVNSENIYAATNNVISVSCDTNIAGDFVTISLKGMKGMPVRISASEN
jgi:hypothetical protein